MDIGVGAFIVSSAIVSAHARRQRPRAPGTRCGLHCENELYSTRLLTVCGAIVGHIRPRDNRRPSNESSQTSLASKFYAFFRPIALVLVFGVARFLTVKGVNYQVCCRDSRDKCVLLWLTPFACCGCFLRHTQEHVTEYGVHWNFYFTLAGVYLVYSLLQLFGDWAASPISAVVIMLGALIENSRSAICASRIAELF